MRYVEIFSEEFEVASVVDPTAPDVTTPAKPDLIPKVVSFTPKTVTIEIAPFDASVVNVPSEVRVVALPSGAPDMSPGEAISAGFQQTIQSLTLSPFGGTIAAMVPDVVAGKYIGKVYVGYPES